MAKNERKELENSKFHKKVICKQCKKLKGHIKTGNLLKWIIILLQVNFMKIGYVIMKIQCENLYICLSVCIPQ